MPGWKTPKQEQAQKNKENKEEKKRAQQMARNHGDSSKYTSPLTREQYNLPPLEKVLSGAEKRAQNKLKNKAARAAKKAARDAKKSKVVDMNNNEANNINEQNNVDTLTNDMKMLSTD